ncbi:transmembrane protein, putative [Medicago truncatula]|uniref:Transmembrane protein, putative n=1 Tax=Medicago truncatula TaxID=3880 RepID=A0A072UCK2_MEDTR|nr:transmembrane protein, putative [Medicago truncatula]
MKLATVLAHNEKFLCSSYVPMMSKEFFTLIISLVLITTFPIFAFHLCCNTK